MREIIESGGYLVYQDTGERVVFYECDPNKNTECPKGMCRKPSEEDEASWGLCAKTTNPVFRKEGGRSWYAVQKTPEEGEPYWGREYL